MNLFKKITSFSDIKFFWILLISITVFVITLFVDYYDNPAYTPVNALVGYGLAIMIGGLWAIFNYVGHMKINVLYRNSKDLSSFVERLTLNKDEKIELLTYMEDYVQNLVDQGKPMEEATSIAINQFKIKEFDQMSKDSAVFHLPAHHYLIGYAFLTGVLFVIWLAISNTITSSLYIIVMEATCFAYATGFIVAFFMYKLIDIMIYKKL
ncbi:hypothetical protein SAMN04487944_102234 [Gracilibacillus ureilyticus]|uniref:Uncharacterized protein n=1 Tax=Gracilibacillus ureilyticus TaxID=531814 RepID=A0A1H9MYZ0_9BACI|nr:hypothetical protein [Gracilibacillus ureilyticus]SER28635.1 hypothetical protein SAMN04487944_102234 [Gracilibacillus ureilyticus]